MKNLPEWRVELARKSDGEKIDELEKIVSGILERLKNIEKTLNWLADAHKESGQGFHDLQRKHETEVAVLKKEIEELRRRIEKSETAELKAEMGVLNEKITRTEAAQERVGSRAWSIVPNVLGAIVNGLIAAFVAYSVAKR